MGIRCLTTYIENRADYYFEKHELHDCDLVIDGDSLCKLYNSETFYRKNGFTSFSTPCYGGDYDKYANVLRNFFKMLKECNVEPYIVFGGGYEDHRVPVVKARLAQKVKSASAITPDLIRSIYGDNLQGKYKRKSGVVYPIGTRYTIMDMINELQLKVHASTFESDNEIACLAKLLNCPVLSMDSDFFIFGSMYIPFDSLNCNVQEKVIWRNHYKYILCKIYRIENLKKSLKATNSTCKHYLLPVLCGNDYIDQNLFRHFFQTVKFFGNEYQKIQHIFNWLTRQDTLESAIELILNSFDTKEEKNSVFEKIKKVILGYMPVPIEDMLTNFQIKPNSVVVNHSINFEQFEKLLEPEIKAQAIKELEDLFSKKFTKYQYPLFFMEMLLENRYFVQPDIEDCSRPDANIIGYNIMSAIHKILVQSEKRLTVLQRNSSIELEELVLPKCTALLPSIEEIERLDVQDRQKIIFQILEIDNDIFNEVSNEWHLFLLSLKYSLSKTEFHLSFVYSLILCFITLNYVDSKMKGFFRTTQDLPKLGSLQNNLRSEGTETTKDKNIFSEITQTDCLVFMHKICKNFGMNPEDTAKTFDRGIMHSMAQFKCVFLHLKFLNVLLNNPFKDTGLCKVFNGTLIYNITKNLRFETNLKNYFTLFLHDCPSILASLLYVVELLRIT